MSKHTPGPWSVLECGRDDAGFGYAIYSEPYGAVGYWSGHKDYHKDNFWRLSLEDARLIAAAPDMFAALEAAVECGMVPKTSAREGGAAAHARQTHVADMVRDALAKARGE
jgi:hypothetical protein